jgi:hypothetical protein
MLLAVVAVLLSGLLSGCKVGSWSSGNGVAKQPAPEILDRARSAAASAGSVHVRGQLVSGGQRVSIDMRLMQDKSALGVISMGAQTLELVRRGADLYVRGSDSFYRSLGIAAMPRQLKGKYLKVRAGGNEFASLAGFTDMERIFDMFLASPAPLAKGKKRKMDGVRVIGVVERVRDGRTLYVALQGEPFPLRISSPPDSAAAESISFLEYNQPFTMSVPRRTNVVDLNQLTKAAA